MQKKIFFCVIFWENILGRKMDEIRGEIYVQRGYFRPASV